MKSRMCETLAKAVDGLPRASNKLPDGSLAGSAAVPSSRVPLNLIHLLEAARRGLDNHDFDTVDAHMSVWHHVETKAATVTVVLRPQTGE